jgi:hypothetical protein
MEYLCEALLHRYKKYKPKIDDEKWFQKLSREKRLKIKNEIEYLWFVECTIAKILIDNPHPNIVTIYKVEDDYIEMEYLNTRILPNDFDLRGLYEAKKHLQKLGIAYIDWKHDNIGTDFFGRIKIFDFNFSGLYHENEWMINPIPGYVYKEALKNDYRNPMDIDNYAFLYGLFIDRVNK